ncbi:hypothetical protein CEXT_679861 [Caerostris extrusa]|uniref:Uncharacterized protein n=1 Tax=Caerostris extrusa TaxID=172846 RepID=A0AAV4NZN0_CAEEX|nr:hypothetical protein CEXT_679861 [Caerostris extrusa]
MMSGRRVEQPIIVQVTTVTPIKSFFNAVPMPRWTNGQLGNLLASDLKESDFFSIYSTLLSGGMTNSPARSSEM